MLVFIPLCFSELGFRPLVSLSSLFPVFHFPPFFLARDHTIMDGAIGLGMTCLFKKSLPKNLLVTPLLPPPSLDSLDSLCVLSPSPPPQIFRD